MAAHSTGMAIILCFPLKCFLEAQSAEKTKTSYKEKDATGGEEKLDPQMGKRVGKIIF